MTIAAGEALFVDTNVLLTATAPGRAHHRKALAVLESWPARGIDLFASGQVVREYLVVATRPVAVNGLGLSTRDAQANVNQFLTRVSLLEETRAVVERLLELVRLHSLEGKRVHDANIVATATAHGIRTLLTDNAAHFRGLGELRLLELRSA